MTGPSNDLMNLFNKVSVDSSCSGIDNLPTITYVIDGVHYPLKPREYVMMITNEGISKPAYL